MKRKIVFIISISLIIINFSITFSVAEMTFMEKQHEPYLCSDDCLSRVESIGRNEWALKCRYIPPALFDLLLYEDSDDYRDREMRHYVAWVSFLNPDDYSDYIIAPTSRGADCFSDEIAQHYSMMVIYDLRGYGWGW